MEQYRTEKDSLGEVKVPKDAYWGAQTQRAIENFPVSGIRFPSIFIKALAQIKRACATVNRELGALEPHMADAILKSCTEIAEGKFHNQFPLDIFQTGSGTSTNMNVNEVAATRANEILTGAKNTRMPVHPNQHVNMGQSSNDVIPTAIHVAACLQVRDLLLPAMSGLAATIRKREQQHRSVLKTGRTHLMDAMPMTVAQELSGWAAQVENAQEGIGRSLLRLSELAMGGTAVGTGVNTPKGFGGKVARRLSELTKFEFRESPNHFEAQSAQDGVVELSGQLKTYATALIKISNDLRWMNSGPLSGIGEIRLPALQPGSSIMPGKVNPVIPEAVRMAATQVIGNDVVVSLSNAQGEFQLNVMLPVMAHNILQSIKILANVSLLLGEMAIAGFEVDEEKMAESLMKNPIVATVLNPIIGYDKAAEVVKKAMKEKRSVKDLAVEMGYLSKEEAEKAFDPKSMTGPS